MKLLFKGWESKGLRCPDIEVEFERSKPFIFFQMPNGTGKSTTISLIKACLSGDAQHWDSSDIANYRNINPDYQSNDGEFQVDILIDKEGNQDYKEYSFRIEFDFSENSIEYKTSESIDGERVGYHPPTYLRHLLSGKVHELYLIDGTKNKRLYRKEFDLAENSMQEFSGIDEINNLIGKVKTVFEQQRQQQQAGVNVNVQTQQGVTQHTNRLRVAEARKIFLSQMLVDAENRIKELKANITKLREQIETLTGGPLGDGNEDPLKTAMNDAKAVKNNKKELLDNVVTDYFEALRNPLFVSPVLKTQMEGLRLNMERQKLPKKAGKEFLEDLMNDPECICGVKMTAAMKKYIKDSMENYLGEENVVTLGNLKNDISEYAEKAEEFNDLDSMLDEKQLNYDDADQIFRDAEREFKQSQTGDVQAIIEELTSLSTKKSDNERIVKGVTANIAQGELKALTSERNIREVNKIKLIDKFITKEEKILAQLTNTEALRKKKNTLLNLLEQLKKLSAKKIKQELKKSLNSQLETFFPGDKGVRIKEFNSSLELGLQFGEEIVEITKGSTGQELTVAYSFFNQLLDRSNHTMPIVVDHPVPALDTTRRDLTAQTIANFAEQFIGFLIDSEKTGFVDSFIDLVDDENQFSFFTFFSKEDVDSGEISIHSINAVSDEKKKVTPNSYLISGFEYFNNFGFEGEEEEGRERRVI